MSLQLRILFTTFHPCFVDLPSPVVQEAERYCIDGIGCAVVCHWLYCCDVELFTNCGLLPTTVCYKLLLACHQLLDQRLVLVVVLSI